MIFMVFGKAVFNYVFLIFRILISFLILATSLPILATDVDLGEYESMPAGTNAFLAYYKTIHHKEAYVEGRKVLDDADLVIDAAVLRFAAFRDFKGARVVPQAILPIASYRTAGDYSVLGDVSGIGDLLVPMPVFLINKPDKREYLALNPIFHVPIGDYDNDKLINIGENRWKYELQLGYIRPLGEKWNLDATFGATFFGENDDLGPESLTLKQDPEYKGQFYLNYLADARTRYGVGLVQVEGGETKISGIPQNDENSTTRFALSYAKTFTATDQILISVGRDLSRENGAKEEGRLIIRFMHLY